MTIGSSENWVEDNWVHDNGCMDNWVQDNGVHDSWEYVSIGSGNNWV